MSEYKNNEVNIGDEVCFTEDEWNTKYKGKVLNKWISAAGVTYRVNGLKYGRANVGKNSIKKIK